MEGIMHGVYQITNAVALGSISLTKSKTQWGDGGEDVSKWSDGPGCPIILAGDFPDSCRVCLHRSENGKANSAMNFPMIKNNDPKSPGKCNSST